MRALLYSSNKRDASFLRKCLREQLHRVETATERDELQHLVNLTAYDLVVLNDSSQDNNVLRPVLETRD